MTITNEDLIGNIIPNVHVSRIILQSSDKDKLIGNIQFVLQDTSNNEDIYSWLEEDSDALKYLTLLVIQSADEQITDSIQESVNTSGVSSVKVFTNMIKDLESLHGKEKISMSVLRPFPSGKTLQQLLEEDMAEKIVNSDGSDTYNVYFDLNMPSKIDESPQHLSYLFLSYYDLNALLKKDFEELIPEEDADYLGVEKLTVENVILDGELVTTTNIFLNERDEIWPGPTHTIMRQGKEIYRSGQTEDSNSFDLRLEKIENYKVQDFRELKRMKAVQSLDPNLFENSFLEEFENLDFEQELLDRDNRNIISDLYPSIDSDNRVAITFALDFKKMFINKSLYGKALSRINSQSVKNYIDKQYKMAKIESIVLRSKRIDLDDSLSGIKQEEKIIAEFSGDEDISTIEKKIFFKSIDERRAEQLRVFSIPDLSKRGKNGVYQYSVEIEYLDNVIEQIKDYINRLELERKKFLEFYDEAVYPSKFNTTSNRFRPDAFSQFPDLDMVVDFSVSGQFYLSIVKTLFNVNTQNLLVVINSWLNPLQATPKSIYSVIELYNNLIKDLENSISMTPSVNNSMNEKNEGFAEPKKTQSDSKSVRIKKIFNKTLDLNYKFKYEYLNITRADNTGITNNSPYLYEALKADIISKKFNNDAGLTVENENSKIDSKVYANLFDLLAENTNLQIKKTAVQEQKNYQNVIQDLLRSVEPLEKTLIKEKQSDYLFGDVNPQDHRQLSSVMFNLLNATVSQDSDMNNISFVINTNEQKNIFWKIDPKKFIDGGKDTKITGLFRNRSFEQNHILDLPNHIKSLIKMRLQSPDNVIGDAEIRLRYELLKKVQVLDGFRYNNENECFDLKSPIWKTLTDPSILETEQVILCKLVDYQNNRIGYKFNQTLKEITTNEYFFINNSGIDNNGRIENGATHVSVATFENRCTKEVSKYFSGEEMPDIKFSSGTRVINQEDNYKRTKYSFLAPHAIYFDSYYRVIGAYMLEFNITNIQIAIPTVTTQDNNKFRYPGLKFAKELFTIVPAIKQKYNPILSSIYSKSGKVGKR